MIVAAVPLRFDGSSAAEFYAPPEEVGTQSDLAAAVLHWALRQVDLASDAGADQRSRIRGDGRVRQAFRALPPSLQRETLLAYATPFMPARLQRMASLFGAPPYFFLKPGDLNLIRAAGLSHARSNMLASSSTPNRNSFSPIVFDEEGRGYGLANDSENQLIGAAALQNCSSTLLYISLPKRKRGENRLVSFPGQNCAVRATETTLSLRLREGFERLIFTLTVRGLQARSHDGRTATVLVGCEQLG